MDVIVHGGAGDVPDDPDERQRVLDEAATIGAESATPLDAVEVAIRVLEHYPSFNAGVGACVQSDGIPRTDAGVMTSDGGVGAACSMPGVEHAVTVARVVHEETPHVLLAGVHAVDLAAAFDVPVEVDLWSERTQERWADEDAPPQPMRVQADWVRDRWAGDDDSTVVSDATAGDAGEFGGGSGTGGRTGGGDGESTGDTSTDRRGDTVGVVAVDGDGTVAAATSTGGRWAALAGRVGDVPQVGSGFVATPAAGASATGAGEDIARANLSRQAVERVEAGEAPADAAAAAIDAFEDATASTAGIVVADAEGRLGSAFNSDAMQTARERR